MAKKKKQKKQKNKKMNTRGLGFQFWLFILVSLIMSVVFLASTLLLLVGMLPTLIAALIVQPKFRHKILTIGALNFAGCFPFLMNIWNSNDRMVSMLEEVSNPLTIVIMYAAAGIGYLLNHVITRLVKVLMLHNAERKLESIEKEKEKLEKRWGRKVRGDLVLDLHGFPVIQNDDGEKETASSNG